MLAMKPLTENSKEKSKVAFCLTDEGIVTFSGSRRQKIIYAINVTDLSISRHIPAQAKLTGTDVMSLAYLSYLYTLRIADTRMMRRLTKVEREVVTMTRDNVFMSFDVVKYKIATLRCVVQRLTPNDRERVERNFIECGLTHFDAVLYYLLYDNNDIQSFCKIMNTIEDSKFTLSIDVLSKEIDRTPKTFSEFEKAATYHTWTKLRFIANGNRFEFTDIKHDLLMRSVQAYYWVRPFYSQLHATNYAKSALRGFTNVLIDHWNKEDRRRTVQDEESPSGYSNIIREITDDVLVTDIRINEELMVEYLDAKRNYV